MDKIVKTFRFTHCYGNVFKKQDRKTNCYRKNPKEWAIHFCVSLLQSQPFMKEGTEVIIFLTSKEHSQTLHDYDLYHIDQYVGSRSDSVTT